MSGTGNQLSVPSEVIDIRGEPNPTMFQTNIIPNYILNMHSHPTNKVNSHLSSSTLLLAADRDNYRKPRIRKMKRTTVCGMFGLNL